MVEKVLTPMEHRTRSFHPFCPEELKLLIRRYLTARSKETYLNIFSLCPPCLCSDKRFYLWKFEDGSSTSILYSPP